MASMNSSIAEVFSEAAELLKHEVDEQKTPVRSSRRPAVLLAALGSEHGVENGLEAARLAIRDGLNVHVLADRELEGAKSHIVQTEEESQAEMERLLDSKKVSAAVAMHYPFPIGISTVGRVLTPAQGKALYIASTTGTSSAQRIEAMVLNAISGLAAAKACGIKRPRLGILNIDGARQVEKLLLELKDAGFDFDFAESNRSDGGCVMRGNDVLQASCDVLICDSLTGNVLTKMLSSFSTGGSYEALGWGYGPGLGREANKLVLIVSRASGAPVVANALKFAEELVLGDVLSVLKSLYEQADKAGLKELLEKLGARSAKSEKGSEEAVVQPPAETVTASISGIDVLDLDDAVHCLWSKGIYAEAGMGCTGPIVRVSDEKQNEAEAALKEAGYIA